MRHTKNNRVNGKKTQNNNLCVSLSAKWRRHEILFFMLVLVVATIGAIVAATTTVFAGDIPRDDEDVTVSEIIVGTVETTVYTTESTTTTTAMSTTAYTTTSTATETTTTSTSTETTTTTTTTTTTMTTTATVMEQETATAVKQELICEAPQADVSEIAEPDAYAPDNIVLATPEEFEANAPEMAPVLGDAVESLVEEYDDVVEQESNAMWVSDADYILLCNCVAHEAGSDVISVENKAKVVEVVMNRVASGEYPDTIYGVITQRYQFSGSSSYCDLSGYSSKVTSRVQEAVDLYLANPEAFNHGYTRFYGDGSQNHFS